MYFLQTKMPLDFPTGLAKREKRRLARYYFKRHGDDFITDMIKQDRIDVIKFVRSFRSTNAINELKQKSFMYDAINVFRWCREGAKYDQDDYRRALFHKSIRILKLVVREDSPAIKIYDFDTLLMHARRNFNSLDYQLSVKCFEILFKAIHVQFNTSFERNVIWSDSVEIMKIIYHVAIKATVQNLDDILLFAIAYGSINVVKYWLAQVYTPAFDYIMAMIVKNINMIHRGRQYDVLAAICEYYPSSELQAFVERNTCDFDRLYKIVIKNAIESRGGSRTKACTASQNCE